jgi:hypothetical protein
LDDVRRVMVGWMPELTIRPASVCAASDVGRAPRRYFLTVSVPLTGMPQTVPL